MNGVNAIDENGNIAKEFSDKINSLKENKDKEGVNKHLFYYKNIN